MITIYGLSGADCVIRYVGLTRNIQQRFYQYRKGHGHTLHLRNWLQHIGDALQFHTLIVVPPDLGDAAERWWIRCLLECGNPLINYTTGGEGNYSPTAEVRAKVGAAQKIRLNNGTHNFLRPEVRAKVRAAGLARRGTRAPWATKHFSALNKARTGIPLLPSHRARVAAALVGKHRSDKARAQDRVAARQRWEDPVYRATTITAMKQSPLVEASMTKAIAVSAEKRRGVALTAEHRQKVSSAMKGRRNAGLAAYWMARKLAGTAK